jgi:hypothetical protein
MSTGLRRRDAQAAGPAGNVGPQPAATNAHADWDGHFSGTSATTRSCCTSGVGCSGWNPLNSRSCGHCRRSRGRRRRSFGNLALLSHLSALQFHLLVELALLLSHLLPLQLFLAS